MIIRGKAISNGRKKALAKQETIEFRKELVDLMVSSLVTNLELCACTQKDTKKYCESLMSAIEKAHKEENIGELDKLFGMCRKVLLENNII